MTKTETTKDGSSVTENKAADGSTGTVKTDKNGQTTAETTLSNKAIEDAKKNGEAVKAPVEVEATKNSSTAPVVKVELPKKLRRNQGGNSRFQREARHGGSARPPRRHGGDFEELRSHGGRYPVDCQRRCDRENR